MPHIRNKIWITWETQRRNIELSRELSCEYFEFNFDCYNRLIRYIMCIFNTIWLIFKRRPHLIICQNPSILLPVLVIMFRFVFKYKVVVDAHNSGIYPKDGNDKFLNFLSIFVQKKSNLIIVTNKSLMKIVEKNNGTVCVLPDKIPELKNDTDIVTLQGRVNLLFICSFNDDEPYQELLESAKDIPKDVVIYITGDYKKLEKKILNVLPNVKLLGFVPWHTFDKMLNSVDCVIDLTNRNNCLVCGAYEALGAEKPMILSNSVALMEYFEDAAIFVNNNAQSIASGIKTFLERPDFYKNRILFTKQEIDKKWKKYLYKVLKKISNI